MLKYKENNRIQGMQMQDKVRRFLDSSSQIIVGKEEQLLMALTCLIADGHLLIEDIPGVGKTTMAKYLCRAFGLQLGRIQFTNDLLPADILGTQIFKQSEESFVLHKGPIFSQVVLADELNRASAKTQSALLQVMEEGQVTLDGQVYTVPRPFFVIATQNPRSQIGTNPLPESQLDRFLMKMKMGVPDREAEMELLLGKKRRDLIDEMKTVIEFSQLLEMQKKANEIHCAKAIADYILRLLEFSRSSNDLSDLSPRAGLDLIRASKAYAFISARDFINPEDVQKVAPFVLGHRLVTANNSHIEIETQATKRLIENVEVY
jgi:MoxR-like ATPase